MIETEINLFSSTNETALYLCVFLFLSLPIGGLGGEILAPFSIGC